MSNQSEWAAAVDNAVDSLIQGTPGQPVVSPSVVPGGAVRTAEGGQVDTPAQPGAVLQDVHGSVYDGYNLERTIQGDQSLESLSNPTFVNGQLPAGEKSVRVGLSVYKDGVGLPSDNTQISRSDYNMPLNNVAPNMVNNVSARFMR